MLATGKVTNYYFSIDLKIQNKKYKKVIPKLGVMVHACNTSTWKAEAGGI
jgi:hypothetical protein